MSNTNLWTNQAVGPTYTTGGYVITTTLSSIASFNLEIRVPGANVGQIHYTYTTSGGQVTVKLLRDSYSKLSFGSPTGLPSGVTNQSTSGQTVAAEASHTMDITHGHGTTAASATMVGGSGQVTQAVTGGVNTSTHTHTVTIPSQAFTSGAGSSHTHTWSNIYEHAHSLSQATTDATLVEMANGTDLSDTVFNYIGSDQ